MSAPGDLRLTRAVDDPAVHLGDESGDRDLAGPGDLRLPRIARHFSTHGVLDPDRLRLAWNECLLLVARYVQEGDAERPLELPSDTSVRTAGPHVVEVAHERQVLERPIRRHHRHIRREQIVRQLEACRAVAAG